MVNKSINITIAIYFFLFPLFFLSTTADFYEYNKLALTLVLVISLAWLLVFQVVKQRRFALISSTFTVSFFLLTVIIILSTLFNSPNIVVALTTPLSTTTYVSGFALYLLLVHAIEEKQKQKLFNLIIFASLLLSLYSVAQLTGIFSTNQFTPTGNLVSTTIFLSIIAFYILVRLLSYFLGWVKYQKDDNTLVFLGLSFLVIAATCLIVAINLIVNQQTAILPFSKGWVIALEAFKSTRTLLLGVGPANFITAFTLTKPLSINTTAYWNIIFTSSSSFFLNLSTEAGILAGFLYIVIFLQSMKLVSSVLTIEHQSKLEQIASYIEHFKSDRLRPKTYNLHYILTLIFALLLQAVLPSSMSIFLLTVILLSFSAQRKIGTVYEFKSKKKPVYFILAPSLILTGLILYFVGRAYLAEVLFKRSLDSFLSNRGQEAFTYQQRAIRVNPYLDRYHNAFARTNLLLANSLASKEELTEDDKQIIPRLVQQSIDEARRAITLYRTNVLNWDNLARIYASLINFAQEAETWAQESYKQRIALDPGNPNARIALGGVYLGLNRLEEAEQLFREAVALKPDLANAHYNLSIALQRQEKYQEAYLELQTALAYLALDSEDASRIKKELDDLKELVPETVSTPSTRIEIIGTEDQKLETSESSPSALKNLPLPKSDFSLPEPPISP